MHAAGAAEIMEDAELVQAVLEDFRASSLSDKDKALFAFIEKVNRNSSQIKQADVDEVKNAGWSEEAIYDAITVCSLFNFYNRWCDAAGVTDLSAFGYDRAGKRLKYQGYFPELK